MVRDYDDCDYKQCVDKTTRGERGYQAKSPKNQKNYSNSVKHHLSPLIELADCGLVGFVTVYFTIMLLTANLQHSSLPYIGRRYRSHLAATCGSVLDANLPLVHYHSAIWSNHLYVR